MKYLNNLLSFIIFLFLWTPYTVLMNIEPIHTLINPNTTRCSINLSNFNTFFYSIAILSILFVHFLPLFPVLYILNFIVMTSCVNMLIPDLQDLLLFCVFNIIIGSMFLTIILFYKYCNFLNNKVIDSSTIIDI